MKRRKAKNDATIDTLVAKPIHCNEKCLSHLQRCCNTIGKCVCQTPAKPEQDKPRIIKTA